MSHQSTWASNSSTRFTVYCNPEDTANTAAQSQKQQKSTTCHCGWPPRGTAPHQQRCLAWIRAYVRPPTFFPWRIIYFIKVYQSSTESKWRLRRRRHRDSSAWPAKTTDRALPRSLNYVLLLCPVKVSFLKNSSWHQYLKSKAVIIVIWIQTSEWPCLTSVNIWLAYLNPFGNYRPSET